MVGVKFVKMDTKLKCCVDSWRPVDRIRDRRPFKCNPNFD